MSQYPTDPATIEAIKAYRLANPITNEKLANLFGVSPTFISKYLNNKLDRDPADFTERVQDVLRSIAARLDLVTTIFPNFLTEEFTGRVNLARSTQDVAYIYGPAGTGKTCCALKYVGDHPSTIYVKITGRSTSAADLEAAVFAAMKNKEGHKANQRRWPFLVTAMKGDGGAIIVDNAHRLDRSGRDWAFDFNEETGKAIIFVGNPEMMEKVNTNDQQQSRIGGKWEASWYIDPEKKTYRKQITATARQVAEQFSDPEFAEAVEDLCEQVAKQQGHMRSVRKNVTLAYQLAKAKGQSPREAFRLAHSNLVRNYLLTD